MVRSGKRAIGGPQMSNLQTDQLPAAIHKILRERPCDALTAFCRLCRNEERIRRKMTYEAIRFT